MPKNKKQLKIGSEVYMFDANKRVYDKDKDGQSFGSPIYRKYFFKTTIIEETSRSWIVDYWRTKINKKTLQGIWLTEEEVNEKCWIHDNQHKISEKVGLCNNFEKLKLIEKIIN